MNNYPYPGGSPYPSNTIPPQPYQRQMSPTPPGMNYGMFQHPYASQLGQISARPVTNIEEARAAMMENGNLHVFTDIPNSRIYTKSLAQDGRAIFSVYVLQEVPPVDTLVTNNIETQETIIALSNKIAALETKINGLEEVYLNDAITATTTASK